MTFRLFLSKKAAGFLERISNDDKRRIVEKLKLLEGNPYILPYKKIRGREGTYRIRVGDFRDIFSVHETDILILRLADGKGFTSSNTVKIHTVKAFRTHKPALPSQTDATCCIPPAYPISGYTYRGNTQTPH